MSKYMTVKDMKVCVGGWHDSWNHWLILVDDEPVLQGEFDIDITSPDDYEDEDEDYDENE